MRQAKAKRRPSEQEIKDLLQVAWDLKTRIEWYGLDGPAMDSMLDEYAKANHDLMQVSGMQAIAALLRRAAHT
jgi:hypothetical protein